MVDLQSELAAALGTDAVSADADDLELAGSDLFFWPHQAAPDLIVRPASTEQTAAAVAIIRQAGRAIVPRGAGLSYTGGPVPQTPSVVLDVTRMNHIDVHQADRYVIAGAGSTWQSLADSLRPHGLSAAFPAPISGSHSTIGGAASQNVPGGMDGILGLTVVLADATILRTGTWSLPTAVPFSRTNGPDITGLFLGDCGAFGIKTEISLLLQPERPCAFASFAADKAAPILAALVAVQRQGLVSRAFVLDRSRMQGAAKTGAAEGLRTAAAMAARAGSIGQAIRDVAGLRHVARESAASWSLHLTAEAPTEEIAEAHITQARKLCLQHATEITPSVPKAMRARPYSVRGFLGPDGQRWVPVHGILPLGAAEPCMAALEAHVETNRAAMAAHDIEVSWLMSTTGAYITIEPMLFWPDKLDPIHRKYLTRQQQDRLTSFPPNPPARAMVQSLREAWRNIFDQHGATHTQLGRFYQSDNATLRQIKQALDPDRSMNPGVLGL
jgi:D-lactate dehydrogenase (cytochrome)